jgi:hypothetical protein
LTAAQVVQNEQFRQIPGATARIMPGGRLSGGL